MPKITRPLKRRKVVGELVNKSILEAIHSVICKSDLSWPFEEPVTDEIVPNYSDHVKKFVFYIFTQFFRPMDLSTIGKLIKWDEIQTISELRSHYSLMCANAIYFYPDDNWLNVESHKMKKLCAETIQVFFSLS